MIAPAYNLDMGSYRRTKFPNVYRRGDVLYFTFRDERRERCEVRYGQGTPRQAADAQQEAQERADAIKAGILDPRQAAAQEAARCPLATTLAEYVAALEARDNDRQHIKTTRAYVERWAKACGVTRLAEADAVRMVRWLAEQRWSARSRNYARASILGLLRWASDNGRIPYNPIPSSLVPKASEDADRRRLSRALTPAEFQAILDAAPKRRAYYLMLACTGLRWRELARVTWADVDLEACVLTVQAGQTKNGKRADLPLAAPVVKALAAMDRAPGPIFASEPRLKTWRADLIRAGLVQRDGTGYVDDRGRRIDRKCLRMSFATWLKAGGVDLRDAQRLMRHHSPALTANHYTDIRMVGLVAAIGSIEDVMTPKQHLVTKSVS
jgi:integrase